MAGNSRGPTGAGGTTQSVKDGKTTSLALAPTPATLGVEIYGNDDSLSFELSNAPQVCVPTSLFRISLAEMRVLAWLRDHKTEIVAAEAEFSVDRRAIAAAIAWEALVNNKWSTNFAHNHGFGRSVGPGKVHLSNSVLFGSTHSTWAYQVEAKNLVPTETDDQRKALLQTPGGAIRYIAAAMDLIATIYERQGSKGICDPPMRSNPFILTNEYQGTDPEKWTERVKNIKADETLKPGNPMALWLQDTHNMALIEDGVGSPPEPVAPALASTCTDRDVTAQEGAKILQNAKTYLDVPYSYGGGTSSGIDCSHLIYKAVLGALPQSKFPYADTHGMASSPNLRKLDGGEKPQAGDVLLYSHHAGFLDPFPPQDKAGQTLFSARGDKTHSTPGVTWGDPRWPSFGTMTGYYRVRIPCD